MTYAIHDFMLEQLHLKGTELLVYALVYNFSQDGAGSFYGTNDYAARKVGCTRRCIVSALASLVDAGLLTRSEGYHGGKPSIDYVAVVPAMCEENAQCEKSSQGVCKNFTEGVKNFHTDNISDNRIDKRTVNARATVDKVQYDEFVTMTQEQHDKLVAAYGEEDTEAMVKILNNYKASSGHKYRSDYHAILNWVATRLEEQKRRQRTIGIQPQAVDRQSNTLRSLTSAANALGHANI